MSQSVNDLQTFLANEMDLSATPPEVGGTDWNIRLNALNRANIDWAESNEWEVLKKVHNGLISTSTNNASYSLPANFRKLDGYVRLSGNSGYDDIGQIDPSKNRQYDTSSPYLNILGNDYDGKTMFINSQQLISGASIQFTYYSSVATLATTTQQLQVPDPTFLIQRALYYIYKSRGDALFPEAKVESDRILARMIENENSLGLSNSDRRVHSGGGKYYNWRIGNNG